MKNTILIFVFFICFYSFSQSETDIEFIKTKVENINLQSRNLKQVILKIESAETKKGNEIVAFMDNSGNIKMIRETYIGETEKNLIWNYIEDKKAYFILKEQYTFKYPITAKNFDALKYSKTEESFYLKNDRTIRWIKGKKIIKNYPINAASIENNMIQHITELLTKFEQQKN